MIKENTSEYELNNAIIENPIQFNSIIIFNKLLII